MRIKTARLSRGLTLTEVQAKTGVDYTQQSRIERGDFKRYGPNVQKLCRFLGVTPSATELERLRTRLEEAVSRSPSRRALEAVLDAIDAAHDDAREGGRG